MKEIVFLKNKTIPEDKYQEQFESKGFNTHFVPLIQHTHLPNQALELFKNKEYLSDLKHIIVTSQRTVECLYEEVIPSLSSDEKSKLFNKTVYVVGPATQEFMTRCGFKYVRGGSETGNGNLLADFIIKELLVDKTPTNWNPLLFLVGEIRKDTITKKLTSAGLNVQEVVTYKTQPLEDNYERFKQVITDSSWVVIFSSQGTKEIVQYVKDRRIKIASIGPSTAKYLLDSGLEPEVVSKNPDPVSLYESIMPNLHKS
ncbi:uroporphyrinogen-III synthase HEM4 Ecym_6242 [Eremothecium cymbalariae DBVPG|uniref:Tetrapyrrole biosynthesis uroporphyrinogen III synthase domain-containing protein n=1 Tax=Eremothecium cymbalariae (strain CBS 270.75 / DBVPG 7215 / KCTC 17166 / NRRL Y-17582) TaxID=931890 RepID=G8JVE5_ERECY|nr:hypothetical protein Ecym_6242 [Eremothecium cymbalariae DBVPG\